MMRRTIIFGTLAALFGFAALAQAIDRARAEIGDGTRVARAAENDSQVGHERETPTGRSHERHDETGNERRDAREGHYEGHDKDEAAEHRDDHR
jgi:hypothetical protein